MVNFVKGNPLNARNLTRKPAANLMPSHSAPPLIRRAIPTGEGTFIAEYSACGLAGLDFPAATPDSVNLAGGQASSLSWTTGFQPVVSCADRRDALSSVTGGTPVFRSEPAKSAVLGGPAGPPERRTTLPPPESMAKKGSPGKGHGAGQGGGIAVPSESGIST